MVRLSDIRVTRRTLVTGAASLSAAALVAEARAVEPRRGGTMTVLYFYETPALVSLTSTSVFGSAKVTEGLLTYTHDMKPLPLLATGWTISPDGLTYTFELRRNVSWHDGRAFSADDVVFAVSALKRVHPRGRSTFAQLQSITAADPHTVVLTLAKPVPYLIKALSASESPIVPKHIYEGTELERNPANNAPIGTGPFRFKERVPGSHAVFVRNEAYWAPERPLLDQIIVKFIPDAGARSAALETGAADLCGRTSVALGDVERLRKLPQLGFEQRGYETNQNVLTLFFNLDDPRFANPKVRKAIAHAVNREAVGRVVYYGMFAPFASPIGTALSEYHDPSPSPYAYDVAKAEALLDEAGYKRGADRLRFSIVYDASPLIEESARFAEFVRSTLSRIGIGVEVRTQDVAGYIKRIYTDRDFQMSGMTFSNLIDPSVGVQRIYWSKNFVKGVPFSNATHFSNPRVDELLEAAAVERDPEKRKQQFREFQQIVMNEVPDIPLGAQRWYTIYNRRVHDHSRTAEGLEGSFADTYVTT